MTSRLTMQLGDWDAGTRVARSLAERIRLLILDGRIPVGERLPSERQLSVELGRSRATVSRAYELLAEGGYLLRERGSGTRVTLPAASSPVPITGSSDVIDFTIASVGSTPGMHAATVRALDRLVASLGTPGYSLDGMPELREAIAERYVERGLPTTPDQIIVTSGAMHALTLVLAGLTRRGGAALIEQPTFPHAMSALRRAGMRLASTPVTRDGWDAPHLLDALRRQRPQVAYLIPDFHNPTGATMPDLERARIAAVARQTGTLLVVDETCAELDIERGWAPRPFAAHGRAVLIGSMSKIAWGGLRIGWIRASRAEVQRILAIRSSIDLGTAMLEQCIATELLADTESLLAHTSARLRAGRDALVAGIAEHVPQLSVPPIVGGLSAWLELGGESSSQLSLAARDHGLLLPPGPRFSADGAFERYARIPISWEPEVTTRAMERLGMAWRDIAGRGARTQRHPEPLAVV